VTRKQRRKAVNKQLQYLKRNLTIIEKLTAESGLEVLSSREYRTMLVVSEVYRQQQEMYANNKNRVDDRIVSLNQPHIRPIVRGKAGVSVEFGAKISASCWDGYVFLDRISWDNFNESGDLINQVELFKTATGYYPESVHADKIYRSKANRLWCQERGIRLSGVPLGRPPKNSDKTRKKIAQQDEKIRNSIEGKFGQGKRRWLSRS
jgi:transposase, IS5 family